MKKKSRYYKGKRPSINVVEKTFEALKMLQEGYTQVQVNEKIHINTDLLPIFPKDVEITMDDAYQCRQLTVMLAGKKANRLFQESVWFHLTHLLHPEIVIIPSRT